MKKTIHFFIPTIIGGAETVSLLYANILSLKYDVTVVYIGKPVNINKEPNFKYLFFRAHKMKLTFFRFFGFIKKNDIKQMFTSLHGIAIPLLLMSVIFPKISLIVRQSFMPNRYNKTSITTLMIRYLYPRAKVIIAQTKEMKGLMVEYYKLDPDQIHVIPNPIDPDIKIKAENAVNPYEKHKGVVYVSVGNVREVKGQDVLIEAFQRIYRVNKRAMLYIIGKYNPLDAYYLKLQEMVSKYNLSDNVVFVGFISNPYNYILHANCIVLSSVSEGLPNILLEAAYLKTPIVSTLCVPVIKRIVIDGQNGYTVPVNNSGRLAEAMVEGTRLKIKENKNIPYSASEDILSFFNRWI